jgi:serine/threonine protein kinase
MPADAAFCPNCGARPDVKGAGTTAAGVRTVTGLETISPIREVERATLEPGSIFANRYEIIRKIGEGGMGVVYVAKDTTTAAKELVLKLIHPELVVGEAAVKHLLDEGLLAREIRHPNIVAVYDVSQFDGQPYFTMEFVKGGTLRNWMVGNIGAGREVRVETAAGIIRSILTGLGEAHRMGFVHRDLKPENVLLVGDPHTGDYNLKILDFGIAKAVGGARSATSGAVGTPLYMAPEQMTAADAVGPAADIYSVSVIFYELLMEASPQARWEPISRNRSDVPAVIDALIEKGLSARPRSRQQSVAEYLAGLDRAMAEVQPKPDTPLVPPLPPNPPPQPLPQPPPAGPSWLSGLSKKPKVWAGVAAAVVVLAIVQSLMGPGPESEGDSDGDGIADSIDQCPLVAGPAPAGCPNTQPPPPQDSDGDGIPDSADQCPQAPGVAPTGCPAQTQAPFNATGFWTDNLGGRYAITHDGANIVGSAQIPNIGFFTVSGTLTRNGGAKFALLMPNGMVAYSVEGRLSDNTHIQAQVRGSMVQNVTYHINHEATQ